jgi:hypothetical protein
MAESNEIPLPPANVLFLVESILMQAQLQLGLFSLGEKDERPEPNLPLARHSIDLLAVLQDKTKGNLSAEEQRLLENGITELRFRYIQVSDELKRRSEPKAAPSQAAAAKTDDGPLIITADGGKGIKTE